MEAPPLALDEQNRQRQIASEHKSQFVSSIDTGIGMTLE
jgi:hypothetical protein